MPLPVKFVHTCADMRASSSRQRSIRCARAACLLQGTSDTPDTMLVSKEALESSERPAFFPLWLYLFYRNHSVASLRKWKSNGGPILLSVPTKERTLSDILIGYPKAENFDLAEASKLTSSPLCRVFIVAVCPFLCRNLVHTSRSHGALTRGWPI